MAALVGALPEIVELLPGIPPLIQAALALLAGAAVAFSSAKGTQPVQDAAAQVTDTVSSPGWQEANMVTPDQAAQILTVLADQGTPQPDQTGATPYEPPAAPDHPADYTLQEVVEGGMYVWKWLPPPAVPAVPASSEPDTAQFTTIAAADNWYSTKVNALRSGAITQDQASYYYDELVAATNRISAAAAAAGTQNLTPYTLPNPPAAPVAPVVPAEATTGLTPAQVAAIVASLGLTGAATKVATATLSDIAQQGCADQSGRASCMATTGVRIAEQLLSGLGSLTQVGLLAFILSPDGMSAIQSMFGTPMVKAVWGDLIGEDIIKRPVTPEGSWEIAGTLLTRAIGLGMAAHVTAQISESNTVMKYMGANYLAGFICDLAGFQRLAQASMGTIEDAAVRIPMRYSINSRVRSTLPNLREAQVLLSRRDINLNQFRQLVAYNGFSADYEGGLVESAYRPVSALILGSLCDEGQFDAAIFTRILRQHGYDDEGVAAILNHLKLRSEGDTKALYASDAVTRYVDGWDTEAQLRDNLTQLGVFPQLLDKYVFGANLREDYDDKQLYLTAVKDAVNKGVMDPPDMSAALVAKGMRQDKADLYAEIASLGLLKAKPKVAANLS
jgi:hypothetical protein